MRPLPDAVKVRHRREAVGDVICTEGDCTIGEALVKQMYSFYLASVASLQTDDLKLGSFVAKYGTTAKTIAESFDDANSRFSRKVLPFSTWCCTIKDVGGQAQALTKAMASELGRIPPDPIQLPGPTASVGGSSSWLLWIGVGAVAALVARKVVL